MAAIPQTVISVTVLVSGTDFNSDFVGVKEEDVADNGVSVSMSNVVIVMREVRGYYSFLETDHRLVSWFVLSVKSEILIFLFNTDLMVLADMDKRAKERDVVDD